MGYVRISKDNCFSVYEYEKNLNEKLGLFFRIGQTVFVKNREEKITGIISVSDYQKCSGNENYQVNKEFKKILFHKGYMEEVRNFFEGTNYQSLPVLYENGELAECFVRTKTAYSMELLSRSRYMESSRSIYEGEKNYICFHIGNIYHILRDRMPRRGRLSDRTFKRVLRPYP